MTDTTTPLRFSIEVELRATPEQVWAAIATAQGLSAWMMPTELEERVGGALVFRMGDTDSKGTVTGWDPPRRIEYEEPDWAALAGHGDADVNPMVTEFLVEARSGGTCVVKVVSSAFGIGADWEREFFAEMGKGWSPSFDVLKLYVEDFAGQAVSSFEQMSTHAMPARELRAAYDRGGELGSIAATGDDHVVVRLDDPADAVVLLWCPGEEDGTSTTWTKGYVYGDGADAAVDAVQARVQAWVEGIAPS